MGKERCVAHRWLRLRATRILQLLIGPACLLALSSRGTATVTGDCNGDLEVTVDEIIRGVNIALGNAAISQCPSLDSNGNGEVTVDELILAVNAALGAGPAPTPTITSTRIDAAAVASTAVGITNVMPSIPAVVTALVSGFTLGGVAGDSAALSAGLGGSAGSCPLGGQATSVCTGKGTVTLAITLSDCSIATATGSTTFGGTLNLTGRGRCPDLFFPPFTATADVQATFKDQLARRGQSVRANVTGTLTPQLGGNCLATAATFVLTGTLTSELAGGETTSLMLDSTNIVGEVTTFSAECFPLAYRLVFDGPATMSQGAGQSDGVGLTLHNLQISQDTVGLPFRTTIDGEINADCFGGAVTLATEQSLLQGIDGACPSDGQVLLSRGAMQSHLAYRPGGEVAIEEDGMGEVVLPSCMDPALLACLHSSSRSGRQRVQPPRTAN